MAAGDYVQPGKVMNYTNAGSAITKGSVVKVGKFLGVALVDIANGASGAVQVEGVFEVAKTAGTAWAQGDTVNWDVSASKFDANTATPATGDVSGPPAIAWEAAASGATTGLVKFTGIPGTVTT
ncbi:MAG TPA: DUF2190 family protein [Ramlibacter sp.]|nr:DUF2190 family protein [Ramlibacter sp.]